MQVAAPTWKKFPLVQQTWPEPQLPPVHGGVWQNIGLIGGGAKPGMLGAMHVCGARQSAADKQSCIEPIGQDPIWHVVPGAPGGGGPPLPFVIRQHTSPLAQLAALAHDVTVIIPVGDWASLWAPASPPWTAFEGTLGAPSGLEPPLEPELDPDELPD